MASNGNLPPSIKVNDKTTQYFNNFFNSGINVSQNIDDALIGFFQSITGSKDSGTTLAASVLYTATIQGLDIMSFIDEVRSLKKGGVSEHKVAIRFQMHQSAGTHKLLIELHKIGGGEPFGSFFHLRIGKREPYFAHFIRGKEMMNHLNVGAQKSHIGHPRFQRSFGTAPEPSTFDVHPHEVFVWV